MNTASWKSSGAVKSIAVVPLLGLAMIACREEEKRPNILFAIADDMSFGHTSYDNFPEVKTPAFDKIAAEGIYFKNAYCSSPSCTPSRASILTGRNGFELEEGGVLWSFLPSKFDVYPEILANHGYLTGFTGKGWGPGDLDIPGRKLNPAGKAYNEYRKTPEIGSLKISGIAGHDYLRNFRKFMSERSEGQPFCFWFGALEPHREYHKGIGKLSGKNPFKVNVPGFLPDTEEVRNDILDYLFEIEWYDSHLLGMINYLDSIGELDNTIVVMTSDNGMPFPRAKSNLYEYGTHMPLVIRWGKKKTRIIHEFISFADFAPTFLNAAKIPVPSLMSGRSFYRILKGDLPEKSEAARNSLVIYKERHAWVHPEGQCTPARAIRKDNWLLIWNLLPDAWPAGDPDPEMNFTLWPFGDCDDGPAKTETMKQKGKSLPVDFFTLCFGKRPEIELYEVDRDPFQLKNLAADEKYAETVQVLWGELKEKLKTHGDPRMTGTGTDGFERAPYFSVMTEETGWMQKLQWDKLDGEQKKKVVAEKRVKLEENRILLKSIYGGEP